MSRLLLLRHARAAWAEPGSRDFDRPLEPSGREDGAAVARMMVGAGFLPDAVLCSTARRARETWEDVARIIGRAEGDASFTDDLYSTDAAGYLALVREAGGNGTLLVVGHNPMVEDLAFALAPVGDEASLAALASGFPTAGLAVILCDGPLSEIEPQKARLEAFFSPVEA